MAIAIRSESSGTGTASGAGAISITKPATIADNDYVVIVVAVGDDAALAATPSGFTGYSLGSPSLMPDGLAGIYYKKITSAVGEPASYSFTSGASLGYGYWIGSLSGVDLTTPEDVTFASRFVQTNNSADSASVTTVTDNAFVLSIWALGGDASVTGPTSPWSDRTTNKSFGGTSSLTVSSMTKTPAGVTGTASLGSATSTADVISAQFPFRPIINSAPAVVLNTPLDVGIVTTVTPQLVFTGTDADSEDITYEVQIDTSDTFSSPIVDVLSATDPGFTDITNGADTDPFASTNQIGYTLQSNLTNRNTYYWRVRAKDPSGSNTYGSWATTRSFTIVLPAPSVFFAAVSP